jgi:hypothetical protein
MALYGIAGTAEVTAEITAEFDEEIFQLCDEAIMEIGFGVKFSHQRCEFWLQRGIALLKCTINRTVVRKKHVRFDPGVRGSGCKPLDDIFDAARTRKASVLACDMYNTRDAIGLLYRLFSQ